ncbi:MAG: hypothetical protein CMP81_22210 [Fulvimarina sp.]|nr:hypothetical protein [Fulvimarina sp.]
MLENTLYLAAKHVMFDQLEKLGHQIISVYEEDLQPFVTGDHNISNCPPNWKKTHDHLAPEIAVLENCYLFPNGAVLTEDSLYIGREAVFTIDPWRKRHGSFIASEIAEDDSCHVIEPFSVVELSGTYFSCFCAHARNHGHFVHDVLSRVYYEELGAIEPGQVTLLTQPFLFPMQELMFNAVYGAFDRQTFDNTHTLKVERLLVPRNMCRSSAFNPRAIAALRRRLASSDLIGNISGIAAEKVYISRRDGTKSSGGRDFVNHLEIEDLFKQAGYLIAEVSKITAPQQAGLWPGVKTIAGVHGAGLMNMIMCEDADYLELFGFPRGPDFTMRCAVAAGHRCHAVGGVAGDNATVRLSEGDIRNFIEAAV